jgi:hypothetical protein
MPKITSSDKNKAQLQRAYALIKESQFGGEGFIRHCSSCGASEVTGHDLTCELAQYLKEFKEDDTD